jgi:hypothetical protein
MKKLEAGLYWVWVKSSKEWIIAQWYPDVKKFTKYNGSYRFDESEIIFDPRSRIVEPKIKGG